MIWIESTEEMPNSDWYWFLRLFSFTIAFNALCTTRPVLIGFLPSLFMVMITLISADLKMEREQ